MAKIGILSDIHGNLPALQAVLLHAGECDEWWCAGDMVGYGPYPSECVGRMAAIEAKAVAGNHDLGAIGRTDLHAFSGMAREACTWTGAHLEPDARVYLEALTLVLEEPPEAVIFHGSYVDPVWEYVLSPAAADRSFEANSYRLSFNGHSHVPVVFYRGARTDTGMLVPSEGLSLVLEEGARYMVNAGSVGQPRDGDPRACYMVYCTDDQTLCCHRVDYDVAKTQMEMLEVGLPRFLAERLSSGR